MSKSVTFVTAIAQIKAMGEGATFYASDIGAFGGTMSGLQSGGYVEKTGKTKEYIIPIEMWSGDTLLKKVEVYEWRVVADSDKPHYRADYQKRELDRYAKCILQAAEALKQLGY